MDTAVKLPEAAQTETPAMTVLESQQRLQKWCQDNADYWHEDGHAERALYWQARANSCQEVIDGIQRTGNDDFIPF